MRFATAAMLAIALSACGGGISTDFEGIYEIETWTSNTSGCETEGMSVLASQPNQRFYVRTESYYGTDFLNVTLCTTDTACATEAGAEGFDFENGWAFDKGSDGAGWRGALALVTSSGGAPCTGTVSDDTMASPTDGTLRIESRIRQPRPFAPDSDGFCSSDDAIAASSGEPCIRYEAVTASLSAPLP